MDGRAGFLDLEFHGFQDLSHEIVHVQQFHIQGCPAGPGELEQAGEQLVHFQRAALDEHQGVLNVLLDFLHFGLRFLGQLLQHLIHVFDAVLEFPAVAVDIDQGRAQIMGSHVNELLQFLVFVLQNRIQLAQLQGCALSFW